MPVRGIPVYGEGNASTEQGTHGGVIFKKSAAMSSNAPFPVKRPVVPAAFTAASPDGTIIHYDLYDAPSRSAVVIVPGFWRDRRHPSMTRFAELLVSMGYRTAVVDLRGHGDSEGTFGFNFQEHHDIAAVVDDLRRRVVVEPVTLIGFSYGGAIAVSTAARHELPLGSLLLISPVADFQMIVPRINPFTIHRHIALGQALRRPNFEWRLGRSPKLRALDDVRAVHAPICLIHVKNDWLIDHSHSAALYDAANEPKELHIIDIPGNYHADRIFNVAGGEVEPIISAFLARYTPK